ncbi:MAG: hypothetical protein ACHQQQ_07825 [Bacteroidota bacterium]
MLNKSPNWYQIIFYYVYKSQVYLSGGVGSPSGGAAGISGLIIINLSSLFMFINPFIGAKYFDRDVGIIIAISLGITINAINYYFLVANGRFIRFQKVMESQTEEQKRFGKKITWIYSLVTILTLIISMIYLHYVYNILDIGK